MKGRFRRLRALPCALCLVPCAYLSASAAVVHVCQQTLAGGVATQLSDETLETGADYTTRTAPALSGYIFTHWSISTTQVLVNRDRLGRALDAAAFRLYEETTLTANYLPASQDTDADGVADGYEFYWYGGLAFSPDSDTDNDGRTFAEELAAGTDPLMADESRVGGVVWEDGALLQYNPGGLWSYTVRSEPEGVLFATLTDYAEPGTVLPIPSAGGNLAYWSINGVRQVDRHGRALDTLAVTMPSNAIEIVAIAESDALRRAALYWYGNPDVSAQSDTDGDGRTFAEELAAGTDPLMADESRVGGVVWAEGALLQYNSSGLWPYTVRSDPEGVLFATLTDYAEPGEVVPIPTVVGNLAYWTVDGVRQADRHGRALDTLAVAMPSNAVEIVALSESDASRRAALYWYGNPDVSAQSDTDNDGRTFAEELAAGTDPLMADESRVGGVVWADGSLLEADLQPFDQAQGAIVDGAYSQIFTSPIAGNGATSATFGGGTQIWPVVADLNGDGLFDIVVLSATTTNVMLNVGTKGNPEFIDGGDAIATSGVDLATNSTAKLVSLTLDVPAPADALSATYGDADQDGLDDLLVSDSAGRIWYYRGNGERGTGNGQTVQPSNCQTFVLQHKVWGGSYPGFAEGLMLAAVDWEDDGDLDCLAGTADGKLMLLRDPKAGRPTNLRAFAGVDNVLLTWDPNAQSRIRGYRVYRGNGERGMGNGELGTENSEPGTVFGRIAQTQLPTYRDFPGEGGEFAYKVSSVSRFYRAGNSTPTESESVPTEAVTARLGGVRFFWNDAGAKVGERVEVVLSIENALNFNVAGRNEAVAYDPAFLRPVEVRKSGLTEGCELTAAVAGNGDPSAGSWNISMTVGVLPAGSGRFLTFVFEALQTGETKVGGAQGATVAITAAAAPAPYRLGDLNGDGQITHEDLQLLARLKNGNGQKPTADQIRAGDFNGNGKLDNADYQAMKKLLREEGVL